MILLMEQELWDPFTKRSAEVRGVVKDVDVVEALTIAERWKQSSTERYARTIVIIHGPFISSHNDLETIL